METDNLKSHLNHCNGHYHLICSDFVVDVKSKNLAHDVTLITHNTDPQTHFSLHTWDILFQYLKNKCAATNQIKIQYTCQIEKGHLDNKLDI